MARTSIDLVVALHQKLVAGTRERSDETLKHIESTLEAFGIEERDAIRDRVRARLERLRTDRDRMVGDFDVAVRALEAELARLDENAVEPMPREERPPGTAPGDGEAPRSERPPRPPTRARKRGRREG